MVYILDSYPSIFPQGYCTDLISTAAGYSQSWVNNIDFWSALTAAIIGGALTIAGSIFQINHQQKKQRKAIKSAIACEIETILFLIQTRGYENIYRERAKLAASGKFNNSNHYPVIANKNYFSVFEANAQHIGIIEPNITRNIINLYQHAKSWLDTTHKDNIPVFDDLTNEQMRDIFIYLADDVGKICDECIELISKLRK